MKIAFLNLCHTDPRMIQRVGKQLTQHSNIDMYVHVDKKTEIEPFVNSCNGLERVYFVQERYKVYWGGFNAVKATMALLQKALESPHNYDYYVLFQNLDYPIKSNVDILTFFDNHKGTEFLRGCLIARTKDWHYSRKYKIYNQRDDDYYLELHSTLSRYLRYCKLLLKSVTTIGFNGVIKDGHEEFPIYYGAAQWAITRSFAEYVLEFYRTHKNFNEKMKHIQFPDEEYFHTVLHTSPYKESCIETEEAEQRWLVNWRNLHYFEFPKSVTVFTEADYERLMARDELFIRKVKSGVSDKLLDQIDEYIN